MATEKELKKSVYRKSKKAISQYKVLNNLRRTNDSHIITKKVIPLVCNRTL